MSPAKQERPDSDAIERTVKQAFANGPEDVISPLKCAADTFMGLHEILNTIRDEAKAQNSFRIQHLADAGAYLAFDHANYCGCQYEHMAASLGAVGIKVGGEV